jgi:hypothetical protein
MIGPRSLLLQANNDSASKAERRVNKTLTLALTFTTCECFVPQTNGHTVNLSIGLLGSESIHISYWWKFVINPSAKRVT